MSFSVDVNLLLYAVNRGCPEHADALAFLNHCADGDELMCVTWPTLMAFLRISTHPAIFPAPLTWKDASSHVSELVALPHLRVLGELDGFWDVYRDLAEELAPRGNLIADLHVAAILKQNGVATFFTNDADFRKFDFLTIRNPLRR